MFTPALQQNNDKTWKLIIIKRCCSITMQRRRHIGPDGKLKQQTNSVSFGVLTAYGFL